MKELLKLILSFTKVGCFTFGGGSACAPLIHKEAVEKHKWINEAEFLEIVVIANSLPGPSMVEMATAIGYKIKGYLGAIIASIAITLPMIFVFTLFILFLNNIIPSDVLTSITLPILATIAALMLSLSKRFLKEAIKDIKLISIGLIIAFTFSLIYFLNVHPSLIIVLMILIVSFKRGDGKC